MPWVKVGGDGDGDGMDNWSPWGFLRYVHHPSYVKPRKEADQLFKNGEFKKAIPKYILAINAYEWLCEQTDNFSGTAGEEIAPLHAKLTECYLNLNQWKNARESADYTYHYAHEDAYMQAVAFKLQAIVKIHDRKYNEAREELEQLIEDDYLDNAPKTKIAALRKWARAELKKLDQMTGADKKTTGALASSSKKTPESSTKAAQAEKKAAKKPPKAKATSGSPKKTTKKAAPKAATAKTKKAAAKKPSMTAVSTNDEQPETSTGSKRKSSAKGASGSSKKPRA